MRQLHIYTTKYEKELRNFAAQAMATGTIAIKDIKTCENRKVFELKLMNMDEKNLPNALTALLMDIVEIENPVYKHSPRLRKMAQTARNSSIYKREVQRMKTFLEENKALHLEGYATFRLSEYREKLDTMIYQLVKKIKFSQGD
ncbi:MAG: hypothetical protein FWE05_00280 [Defluviitaleaceae bacterium]|nr:hypothetical protein [Defluviitaleaceae bacterium]